MIYLGHFSFAVEASVEADEPGPSHGYCTCVADAESVDDALDKFKALLHRLRATDDLFDDVQEIYLDACIEIKAIPAGGFLTFYMEHHGEHPSGIFTWLRGDTGDQADVYHLVPEGHGEGDQEFPVEPFVVFGS